MGPFDQRLELALLVCILRIMAMCAATLCLFRMRSSSTAAMLSKRMVAAPRPKRRLTWKQAHSVAQPLPDSRRFTEADVP
jgi:hypothetical protein